MPCTISPKILLLRSSRDMAAGAQQARSQHRYEAPPCHTHLYFPPLLSTLALLPSQEACNRLSAQADELQNRVTLEKLKSWSVIAGTRSLPVSEVIASAGLVYAAIRLKTRRGLS